MLISGAVMVSTSGHRLIEEDAVEVIKKRLLPLARVITPNIPEAEILAGCGISCKDDLSDIALKLSKSGNVSVLMKAGHLEGDDLTGAARSAKAYIEHAIISGAEYEIGGGHGPVNHFFCLG